MDSLKLFISYSWSSPDHEQWVLNLATELCESGVDVVLDKWDLKEGHDANAFMEKMVSDPEVTKVIMVSDETYADKANGRKGGVGTEAQIISAEVYAAQDQTKFVAVLPSVDPNGRAYLPVYYKSRIYIDLSDQEQYGKNFEQLLRWIYDKPLHNKPVLGKVPSYLAEAGNPTLGTGATLCRALDAIRSSKPQALGSLDDYFSALRQSLDRFRLSRESSGEFDELVVASIESMVVVRNEVEELVTALCRFMDTIEAGTRLHRFLEHLAVLMDATSGTRSYSEWDFDNFRFLTWELYLLCVSLTLKHEAFSIAVQLIGQPYYDERAVREGRDVMASFPFFNRQLGSLEHRNQRLGLRKHSLQAEMLKVRSDASGWRFIDVMQTDFLLSMRSIATQGHHRWYPETLVYMHHGQQPFQIFARCVSKAYADKVLQLLGVDSSGLKKFVETLQGEQSGSSYLRFGYTTLDAGKLLGIERWGTIA
jgi:hypothetical protein